MGVPDLKKLCVKYEFDIKGLTVKRQLLELLRGQPVSEHTPKVRGSALPREPAPRLGPRWAASPLTDGPVPPLSQPRQPKAKANKGEARARVRVRGLRRGRRLRRVRDGRRGRGRRPPHDDVRPQPHGAGARPPAAGRNRQGAGAQAGDDAGGLQPQALPTLPLPATPARVPRLARSPALRAAAGPQEDRHVAGRAGRRAVPRHEAGLLRVAARAGPRRQGRGQDERRDRAAVAGVRPVPVRRAAHAVPHRLPFVPSQLRVL